MHGRPTGGRRYTVYRAGGDRPPARARRAAGVAVGVAAFALVAAPGLALALGWFGGDGSGSTAPTSAPVVAAGSTTTFPEASGPDPTATDPAAADPEAEDGEGRQGDTVGRGAQAPGIPAHVAPINTSYAGISMFRGNGHRAFYGTGPVPTTAPSVLWRFPEGAPMSSSSSEGGESRVWAGTGWTGQPVVVEQDGVTRVMFGAYDRALHVLDAGTGDRLLPDLPTGDLIKGSVMADPDGYPLLYSGSRDNFFRVVALDRAEPEVLWKLDAASVPRPMWNNDWDSSPLVVGDYLFEGGENSYFFIIKLNRGFDAAGMVTVAPRVVLALPGYTDALIAAVGDRTVSIESSPALHLDPLRGDRVYFANGGGRVVGVDIEALGLSAAGYGPAGQPPGTWERGVVIRGAEENAGSAGSVRGRASHAEPAPPPADAEFPVVFDYWAGDDVDATVVIDEEGMLYVAVELERMLARATQVGQLIKLDPYRPGDPLVWSVADPAKGGKGGIWATPALHGDMVYVPTHTGRLLGVDRRDGRVVWEKPFTYHAWGSAAVVDDTLIVGDTDGWIHAYDVSDPEADPPQLWQVQVPGGGAVESTPAVWRGHIYVGSRNGYFYCFGEG